ncbi:hypothetical protein JW766_04000 [Candidatus Dojkabacteria bacterium]|nr:hypothetical protein [Candidatus Dojkabacteria bacterium]
MIVFVTILTIFVILFEISLREISIFNHIALLFILVNLFFWFKKYRYAVGIGVIAGFIIDLVMQNHLGETLLAIFAPLFILSLFDNILKIESRVSRIMFSAFSTGISIFISDFLVHLVYLNSVFDISALVKRIIVSVIVVAFLGLAFGNLLVQDNKTSRFS